MSDLYYFEGTVVLACFLTEPRLRRVRQSDRQIMRRQDTLRLSTTRQTQPVHQGARVLFAFYHIVHPDLAFACAI